MSKKQKESIEGLGGRIRVVRQTSGLSPDEFRGKMGVSLASLYRYEGGEMPDADVIYKLCQHFNVSADWLLLGKGDAAFQPTKYPDLVWIPRYSIELGAGAAFNLDGGHVKGYRAFEEQYLRDRGLDPKMLSVCKVRGDSMAPKIIDGDNVLIDHRQMSSYADDIYAIRYDSNEGVIKKLQFLPGNIVRVVSENPSYKPFEVDLSDERNGFQIIGRAVWHGGDL